MSPKSTSDADLIRVRHMLDAAQETLGFIRGKKRSELDRNRMLTLSLIKEIEMIGEAANKVSESFRKKHASIPWQAIVDTRNHLIHGYFDVDLDILWTTVSKDLPGLVRELKKILSS